MSTPRPGLQLPWTVDGDDLAVLDGERRYAFGSVSGFLCTGNRKVRKEGGRLDEFSTIHS
jgi:hypothetical protein